MVPLGQPAAWSCRCCFGFGLFAYAMYALLGVLLVSRLLTRIWIHNLSAERECNRQIAQVGDTVAVVIQIATPACCRSPGCCWKTCCRPRP